MTTIFNAVDASAYEQAEPARHPARIIFVGRLMFGKGLLDLFAALGGLSAQARPGTTVVVGGPNEVNPDQAEVIEQAAAQCPAEVELLGSLPHDQVRHQLGLAQVFVLPSHYEGQPISLLEAMASGLPVVVTDVGANRQVVRDGQDGCVIPKEDPVALAQAISRLVEDDGLRVRMGKSARRRVVESFDISGLADRLTEQYRQVARDTEMRGPDVGTASCVHRGPLEATG